jgi:MFS transporter, DHA2 family, methylenomycin A resistance protein
MLPLALFRRRLFSLAALDGLLVNVAFYGLIFVLSLYFQDVNGRSAFATGLAFVPASCCRPISSRPALPSAWVRPR